MNDFTKEELDKKSGILLHDIMNYQKDLVDFCKPCKKPFVSIEEIKTNKDIILALDKLTDADLYQKWEQECLDINHFYKEICGYIHRESKLKQKFVDRGFMPNQHDDGPSYYETVYIKDGIINRDSKYFKKIYNIAVYEINPYPEIVFDLPGKINEHT